VINLLKGVDIMEQSNYRYYSNEQLEIVSIDSKLLDKEKKVRRYLMNYVIDNKEAFKINNSFGIAEDIGMTNEELNSILKSLIEKNIIVVDEDGKVNFIYPVSAIPTNHKVKLQDGREFTAMCAIDAIGAAFTFKQNVEIVSTCSNCGSAIKVTVKDGKLYDYEPDNLHILHVDLNKNANWSGNC